MKAGYRAIARPLTLTLWLALGAAPWLVPSQALAAAGQRYDVPAGPLGATLTRIAREGGRLVSFAPELVAGRLAAPVQGEFDVPGALREALRGSGLELMEAADGTLTLRRLPGQPVAALSPVLVHADRRGATTEGRDVYLATGPSQAATGLGLTLRETPQSISVITQQETLDRNERSMQEALRYAPGIHAVANFGESRWWYYSRGFQIENIQYDGVSTFSHYLSGRTNAQDDMAMFDRIEVVRGATGLMTGAGDPSGSINMVRKRATAERQVAMEVTAASIGRGGATLDATGALNDSGSVRGRVVASGSFGAASERQHNDRKYGLVYGALDVDVTEHTTIGLGASLAADNVDGYDWGGLPTQPDGSFYPFYDSSSTAALPWEYNHRQLRAGYLDIEHRFGQGWTLRGTGRLSRGRGDILSSRLMRSGPNGELERSGTFDDQRGDSDSANLQLTGPFTLFGREHQMTVGVSGNRDRSSYVSDQGYDWLVPDPRALDQPGTETLYSAGPYWADMRQRQYGVYAAGRLQLADTLHLILGGRLAWYRSTTDASYGSSGYDSRHEPVPYVGLVFDATRQVALYASYTTIFKPQSYISPAGDQLDPVKGSNVEAGVKLAFLDDTLQVNLAVYQSGQRGLPVLSNQTCAPGQMFCYDASSKIRTRGIDIEVVGAITPRWNVMASYSYADSRYDGGPDDGRRFNPDRMPRSLGKVYTNYRFGGDWQGLSVGGGLRVQSALTRSGTERYSRQAFNIRQPGYAVFDLRLGYRFSQGTEVQLNVDNLFNRQYYAAIGDSSYGNFTAPGRVASLVLRHEF